MYCSVPILQPIYTSCICIAETSEPARIKVRNFANLSKFANIGDENEENEEATVAAADNPPIETICLSSDEETKPSPQKKVKRKPRTSFVRVNRKHLKAPLLHKYHKISEYFPATKVERKRCVFSRENIFIVIAIIF